MQSRILRLRTKQDVNQAIAVIYAAKGKVISMQIIDEDEIRSGKQNIYWHKCLSIFAIHFGYTLSEAKELIKYACPFAHFYIGDTLYLESTSVLLINSMSKLITWLRNYAAIQGLYIPSPEEMKKDKEAIDSLLKQHKEYL